MSAPFDKPAANLESVVPCLAKGFRAEAPHAHEREPTLSEIASRAGLDAGTAFRLVGTRVMPGYLESVESAQRRQPGRKFLDPGCDAIARAEPFSVSRPIPRSVFARLNETASIAARAEP